MPPAPSPGSNHDLLPKLQDALQKTFGPRRYQKWFGSSTQMQVDDAELIIHVASPYLVKWIQKQLEADLLRIAADIIGPDVKVRYEIGSDVVLTPSDESDVDTTTLQTSLSRKTGPQPVASTTSAKRTRRGHSLNDFVVGESNALAMAAVDRILDEPGSVSPLYLHGTVGNGKTHLLEGVRARLRKNHSDLQVVLLTAEHFGNYFSQALSSRTLPSFRARFRNVDVLLVDDVDFFDGKKNFEAEFLHTIKQFESDGRQVILTGNRHPRLLQKTSEELVSRLLSGLVCKLESPTVEMRRDIVKRHVARTRAKFSPEAMELVVSRFTANVRELEGAINLLSTWSRMANRRVSATSARTILTHLERDCLRMVRIDHVEAAVCDFFGVAPDTLRSSSRKQSLSQPRALAMYLARRLTQSAYSEIGAHFGGRNHSTVMSAERKVSKLLASAACIRISAEEWTVQEVVETLEERIKAG